MKSGRFEIKIAEPHGFCSGVLRAIEIAEKAAAKLKTENAEHGTSNSEHGTRDQEPETWNIKPGTSRPVLYCLHELVHNRQVVEKLSANGVAFVKDISEVPDEQTVLFSAHGVSPAIRAKAATRNLKVIDATCVFVEKVHEAVRKYSSEGCSILLIGSRNHDEVLGVAGEAPGAVTVIENEHDAETVIPANPDKVAVVTQTTLTASQVETVMTVLKRRFPNLVVPDRSGRCFATTHRQDAVRKIASESDVVIVLGSPNSANSNRLVDVAESAGARGILIPDTETLRKSIADGLLDNVKTIGVTAGASTPEYVMEDCINALRDCL